MPKRPSRSPAQRQAFEKLLAIVEETGSYAAAGRATKINRGRIWKICNRKSRASKHEIGLLGIHVAAKPRTPWKKKYLLLRKFLASRRAL